MSLTQEQMDLMVLLSAPLVENPLPWVSLSPDQQDAFRFLMPNPSFGSLQRHFIGLWVLPVTPEQVEDMNGLMPPNSVIAPRAAADGRLFVGADLLSDALDGKRLSSLLPILETLPLTYVEIISFPEPEIELN